MLGCWGLEAWVTECAVACNSSYWCQKEMWCSCERVVCFESGFASTPSPNYGWSEVMCSPLFIYPLHHYQYVNRTDGASREIASFLSGARCVTLLTSDETFISHKHNSSSWGILSILINLILYLFCFVLFFAWLYPSLQTLHVCTRRPPHNRQPLWQKCAIASADIRLPFSSPPPFPSLMRVYGAVVYAATLSFHPPLPPVLQGSSCSLPLYSVEKEECF